MCIHNLLFWKIITRLHYVEVCQTYTEVMSHYWLSGERAPFSSKNKKTKRIPLSHAHIIGYKTFVQWKQPTEIGFGLFWSATGLIFRKRNKCYWIAKWSGHSMCFLSSLWFNGSMWWRYVCLLFCSGQELIFCSLWVQSVYCNLLLYTEYRQVVR